MTDFDWRDFPDISQKVQDDNYVSKNLRNEYFEKAGSILADIRKQGDHTLIDDVIVLFHEYKNIATEVDKFSLLDWKQQKMLIGDGSQEPGKLGGILYLIPLQDEQLFDITPSEANLQLINFYFEPSVQIGSENKVKIRTNLHTYSSNLDLVDYAVSGTTIELKFSDNSTFVFDDLASWIDPLNLEIMELRIKDQ